jgi:hypothetical protein
LNNGSTNITKKPIKIMTAITESKDEKDDKKSTIDKKSAS